MFWTKIAKLKQNYEFVGDSEYLLNILEVFSWQKYIQMSK